MAKPKLALIPATIGTKVFSVLPSDGDGDFTFTRATVATRINSLGLIEEVASTKNRLNYDLLDGKVYGCPNLLLEPARTNLVRYSEEINNAWWLKSNCAITSNTSISPDGTLNADTLTITSGTSGVVYKTGIVAGSLSFFAKDINLETATFTISVDGVGSASWDKNGLLTSYGGGTATDGEYYGNGWYRFVFTVTSGTVVNYGISSGTGTNSILVFGLQNEAGSYATSYIKTEASTVTRNGETANGSGNAQTFNDSEGVLMLEASSDETTSVIWSVSNGSNSNAVSLYYGSQGVICDIFSSAGTRTLIATMPIGFRSNMNKFLIKYKSTDIGLWLNGFELAVSTQTISLSGLNELEGAYGSGSFPFYGNTKQIQYFDSELADTQLEELTSWVSFQEMANGQLYIIE